LITEGVKKEGKKADTQGLATKAKGDQEADHQVKTPGKDSASASKVKQATQAPKAESKPAASGGFEEAATFADADDAAAADDLLQIGEAEYKRMHRVYHRHHTNFLSKQQLAAEFPARPSPELDQLIGYVNSKDHIKWDADKCLL